MGVLIITSVQAERDALLRGLSGKDCKILVAGVGAVAAAVHTAKILAAANYSLVISAGIAGGFPGKAPVGSLVLASEIVAADLGAETPEGFCSLEKLGFGSYSIPVPNELVEPLGQALKETSLEVVIGPILTVSTVTGTAESAARLAERVPGAAAEAMEGFGVAYAAQDKGIPVLELRAVSNLVGPRDRNAWKIKEALDALAAASAVLARLLK